MDLTKNIGIYDEGADNKKDFFSIPQPDKVSLLLIDSLRYDCVGYNSDKKYLIRDNVTNYLDTPTLDSICKDSVFFSKCYSTSSTTNQVVASIFTGTTQVNHGIHNNIGSSAVTLNEKVVTIAEILKKIGYTTVYAGDPPKNLQVHKLNRGFDFDFTNSDKKLFAFLKEHKNEKIFLFSLFEDVHGPYLYSSCPPNDDYNNNYFEIMEPLLKKYNVPIPKSPEDYWHKLFEKNPSRELWFPLYIQGVTKFDKGRFKIFINELENNGFLEYEKSLMIITGDHGEGKHTHNLDKFQHGADAYDETARVPLIVRLPTLKHKISNDLVSNMDIFRIVADMCTRNKTLDFVKYPVYSINPLYEKREYCWYILTLVPFDEDPFNYCIHARTIITDTKKITLRGKPETFLNPKIFDLNEREFVLKLYFDLYGRRPSLDEFNKTLLLMKEKQMSKKTLYEKFLNAPEYSRKNHYLILRIEDEFEENPIYQINDNELSNEITKYLQIMIDLERPDVEIKQRTAPISKEEHLVEEEIKKELEKLGYL